MLVSMFSIAGMLIALVILWAMGKMLHLFTDSQSPLATHYIFCSLLIGMFVGYLYLSHEGPTQSLQISDSVEYTLGAFELVRNGSYELSLSGDSHPPRYAPWFSAFFLSPIFSMYELQAGLAHVWLVVGFYSLIAILAAYLVGMSFGASFGGAMAAGIVILLPGFRYYSTQVMTEIPVVALLLLLFACYQGLRRIRKGAYLLWALTGLFLMLCIMLKPLTAGFAIPFVILLAEFMRHQVVSPQVGIRNGVFLLGPVLLASIFQGWYNAHNFGSIMRTGYHYWASIPYDYPSLVWSLSYLGSNLATFFLGTAIIVLLALLYAIPTKREPAPERRAEELKAGMSFIILGSLPLLLFHFLYFYQSDRFFLPVEVLLAALVGGMLGRLMSSDRIRVATVCSACLFVAACLFATLFTKPQTDARSWSGLLGALPDSAILISDENPLLLSNLSPKANLFPWSRSTEYASKLVTKNRHVLNPAPKSPFEHRDERLVQAGGKELFHSVASDSLEFIEDRIEERKPVFVYDSGREAQMLASLRSMFELDEVAPHLFQIKVASASS